MPSAQAVPGQTELPAWCKRRRGFYAVAPVAVIMLLVHCALRAIPAPVAGRCKVPAWQPGPCCCLCHPPVNRYWPTNTDRPGCSPVPVSEGYEMGSTLLLACLLLSQVRITVWPACRSMGSAGLQRTSGSSAAATADAKQNGRRWVRLQMAELRRLELAMHYNIASWSRLSGHCGARQPDNLGCRPLQCSGLTYGPVSHRQRCQPAEGLITRTC
jgi:hypothetical protein